MRNSIFHEYSQTMYQGTEDYWNTVRRIELFNIPFQWKTEITGDGNFGRSCGMYT